MDRGELETASDARARLSALVLTLSTRDHGRTRTAVKWLYFPLMNYVTTCTSCNIPLQLHSIHVRPPSILVYFRRGRKWIGRKGREEREGKRLRGNTCK